MKAVVLSIKDGRAAVLADDGTFHNTKNENYRIGQAIEYKAQNSNGKIVQFVHSYAGKLTAAAAAMILVAGTFTANTYAYSTVTLDINPSLRYGLNVFDKVVQFDSFNEDGEEIVADISEQVLGMHIDAAIETTLNALDAADYIGEETPVVMTVDSHFSKKEKLEQRTKGGMDAWNVERAEKRENKSIDGEAVIVTDELKIKARDGHISPGRVIMMEREPRGDMPSVDSDFAIRDGREDSLGGKEERSVLKEDDLKNRTERRENTAVGPDDEESTSQSMPDRQTQSGEQYREPSGPAKQERGQGQSEDLQQGQTPTELNPVKQPSQPSAQQIPEMPAQSGAQTEQPSSQEAFEMPVQPGEQTEPSAGTQPPEIAQQSQDSSVQPPAPPDAQPPEHTEPEHNESAGEAPSDEGNGSNSGGPEENGGGPAGDPGGGPGNGPGGGPPR